MPLLIKCGVLVKRFSLIWTLGRSLIVAIRIVRSSISIIEVVSDVLSFVANPFPKAWTHIDWYSADAKNNVAHPRTNARGIQSLPLLSADGAKPCCRLLQFVALRPSLTRLYFISPKPCP